MDKIYTRHKIRIPRKSKVIKIKKSINLLIIIIICVLVIKVGIKAIYPVFKNLCEERAKSIATTISNEQATNVMKNYSYDNMFEIEKDNDGNIKMIKSNMISINEITSSIAVKIQEEMNNKEKDNIEIALGTFTGSKILAGRGPRIKIKISTIGNVETDLKSEFKTQGINQTLHRVFLEVRCETVVLTPFNNIESTITNQVLLVENVILGNIPETFYDFNGVDEKEAGMNTLQ